jgi:hypothetical protein
VVWVVFDALVIGLHCLVELALQLVHMPYLQPHVGGSARMRRRMHNVQEALQGLAQIKKKVGGQKKKALNTFVAPVYKLIEH